MNPARSYSRVSIDDPVMPTASTSRTPSRHACTSPCAEHYQGDPLMETDETADKKPYGLEHWQPPRGRPDGSAP